MAEISNLLSPLFYPRSVAVLGASSDFRKPHGRPLEALLKHGFKGNIYLVNPNYQEIAGIRCYAGIEDVPGEVDLAIVGVAAARVLEVLEGCAAKGVKAAVILSSGFSEVGAPGRKMQEKITELTRRTGIRIVGPNCVGIINNFNGLWATFAPNPPPYELFVPNLLGLISQSGFFGVTLYEMCRRQGIGFNYYVSIGNEADLDFADFVEYMIDDPQTSIIGGYIEGVKNGKKLIGTAEKALECGKLLIMMKAGSTAAGSRAALSHTGSLAGTEEVYDAVFRQKGIIRIRGMEQLNTLINVASSGRIPTGRKTAIVSGSGGGAVMLADKCSEYGLEVVPLTAATRRQLDRILPHYASSQNPVDLTSKILTDPELVLESINIVAADPGVDIMIASFSLNADIGRIIVPQIHKVFECTDKPMVAVCWPYGDEAGGREAMREIRRRGIPLVEDLERGVWALSSLAAWEERRQAWKSARSMSTTAQGAAVETKGEIKVENKRESLSGGRSREILKDYGIPIAPGKVVSTAAEAVAAAESLGFPVALKIESPDIRHKTEAGGVLLTLSTPEEVEKGYFELRKRVENYAPSARVEGVLVQNMMPPGTEVIVGIKRDQTFGPVILLGLGGIFVEVLKDISLKVAPLSRMDAVEMMQELTAWKILKGVRGRPGVDTEALIDIILRISQMAVDFQDWLEELDINPLIIYEQGNGAAVVDALIISNREQ